MTPRCRTSVILASAIAHALVFLIFLDRNVPVRPEASSVVMVSLAPGFAPVSSPQVTASSARTVAGPVQPPPPPTPDIAPRFIPQESTDTIDPHAEAVALAVASAASAAPGQTCAMTAWLQGALQENPSIQNVLPMIPRPARSVANAMMLWNAGWVDPDVRAQLGVDALREALTAGIEAAPEACRMQVIRGPELITLVVGDDATVLAIGSGEWRWQDLLTKQ